MMPSLAAGVGALAAAGGAHLALQRARQRTEARITRQRREQGSVSGLRLAGLALVALQAAGWLGAAYFASTSHAGAAAARERVLSVALGALSAPLVSLSGRELSALDLLLAPLAALALWIGASGATQLLRVALLRTLGLEGGSEETVAGLLRYGLLLLGGLIALHALGIDVRGLAIAGGVLGVGIGFGLQNLANNFVSGVVIGLERPIRPGDVVRVGEHFGTILQVGARCTALRTIDRVTVLIPNARFLESEVVNWSHGDPISCVRVPVAVDPSADVHAARGALLAAARSHPAVLREPRAQVQLRALGGDALAFELLVWTRDPKRQVALVSDLNYRIEAELSASGVRLPSTQVDVNLHSAVPATAEGTGACARRERHSPAEPSRDEKSPEEWTAVELEQTLARMAGEGGVARADRRHWLRVYPDCFVGSEAVAWLTEHEGLTRGEARAAGERLVELGWIRHVLDEHGFRDGPFYYRFAEPRERA